MIIVQLLVYVEITILLIKEIGFSLIAPLYPSSVYVSSDFKLLRKYCIITSPARAIAKYCDECVCLSVCPTGYLRNHTRDTNFRSSPGDDL